MDVRLTPEQQARLDRIRARPGRQQGRPQFKVSLGKRLASATHLTSRRELEVLQLVADGYRNPEIAAKLGIDTETVKTHVRKLLVKLGARRRTDAVSIAYRAGLIR